MCKKLNKAKDNLKKAKDRLKEVELYGNDVISKHDLRNGYNAEFYIFKIPMLANSVKYHQDIVNELTPKQLEFF